MWRAADGQTADRWDLIASEVPGKTSNECRARYRMCNPSAPHPLHPTLDPHHYSIVVFELGARACANLLDLTSTCMLVSLWPESRSLCFAFARVVPLLLRSSCLEGSLECVLCIHIPAVLGYGATSWPFQRIDFGCTAAVLLY